MTSTDRDRALGYITASRRPSAASALRSKSPGTFGSEPRFGPPSQATGGSSTRSPAASAYPVRSTGSPRPGGYAELAQARAGTQRGEGLQLRSKTPAAARPARQYPGGERRAATPPSRTAAPAVQPFIAGSVRTAISRSPALSTNKQQNNPTPPRGATPINDLKPSPRTPTISRPAPSTSEGRPASHLGPTALSTASNAGPDVRGRQLGYADALPVPVLRAAGVSAAPAAAYVVQADAGGSRSPAQPVARPLVGGGAVFQDPGDDWLSAYEKSSVGILAELENILGGLSKLGGQASFSSEAGAPPLQLPAGSAPGPSQPGAGPGHGGVGSQAGLPQPLTQQAAPQSRLFAFASGDPGARGAGPTAPFAMAPGDESSLAAPSVLPGSVEPAHEVLQTQLWKRSHVGTQPQGPAAGDARFTEQTGHPGLVGAQPPSIPLYGAQPLVGAGASPSVNKVAGAADQSPMPLTLPSGALGELWGVLQASSQNTARLMADLAAARREVQLANERAEDADGLARAYQKQLITRQQHLASWQAALAEMEERETEAKQKLADAQALCNDLSERALTAEHVAALTQLRLERLAAQRASLAHAGSRAGTRLDADESADGEGYGLSGRGNTELLHQELDQLRTDLAAVQTRATRAELELAMARNKALIAQQELAAEEDRARRAVATATAAREELGRTRQVLELMGHDPECMQHHREDNNTVRGDNGHSPAGSGPTISGGHALQPLPQYHAAAAQGTAGGAVFRTPCPHQPPLPSRILPHDALLVPVNARAPSPGDRRLDSGVPLMRHGGNSPVPARRASSNRRSSESSDDGHSGGTLSAPMGGLSRDADARSPARRQSSHPTTSPQRYGSVLLLAPGEMPADSSASQRYSQNMPLRRHSRGPSAEWVEGEPTGAAVTAGPSRERRTHGASPVAYPGSPSGRASPAGAGSQMDGLQGGDWSTPGLQNRMMGRASPHRREEVRRPGGLRTPDEGLDAKWRTDGVANGEADSDRSGLEADSPHAAGASLTSPQGGYRPRGRLYATNSSAIAEELLPLSRAASVVARRWPSLRQASDSSTVKRLHPSHLFAPSGAALKPTGGEEHDDLDRLASSGDGLESTSSADGHIRASGQLAQLRTAMPRGITPAQRERLSQSQVSISLADLRRQVPRSISAASSGASSAPGPRNVSHTGAPVVGSGLDVEAAPAAPPPVSVSRASSSRQLPQQQRSPPVTPTPGKKSGPVGQQQDGLQKGLPPLQKSFSPGEIPRDAVGPLSPPAMMSPRRAARDAVEEARRIPQGPASASLVGPGAVQDAAAAPPEPPRSPRAASSTPSDAVPSMVDTRPPFGYQTSHLNDLYESRQWPSPELACSPAPVVPLARPKAAAAMAGPSAPLPRPATPSGGNANGLLHDTSNSESDDGESSTRGGRLPLTPRTRMLSPSQLDSYLVRPSLTESMTAVASVDVGAVPSASPGHKFHNVLRALAAGVLSGGGAGVSSADSPGRVGTGARAGQPQPGQSLANGHDPVLASRSAPAGTAALAGSGASPRQGDRPLLATPAKALAQGDARQQGSRRPWWRLLLQARGRLSPGTAGIVTTQNPARPPGVALSTSASSPRGGHAISGVSLSLRAAATQPSGAPASPERPAVPRAQAESPAVSAGSLGAGTPTGGGESGWGKEGGRPPRRQGGGQVRRQVQGALLHVGMWSGGVALGVMLVLGVAGVIEGALGVGAAAQVQTGSQDCGCPALVRTLGRLGTEDAPKNGRGTGPRKAASGAIADRAAPAK